MIVLLLLGYSKNIYSQNIVRTYTFRKRHTNHHHSSESEFGAGKVTQRVRILEHNLRTWVQIPRTHVKS